MGLLAGSWVASFAASGIRSLVFVAFVSFLKPTAGLALAGTANAFLACRDPQSGISVHIFRGPQSASYQFNPAMVAQLRAFGVVHAELSGIGRSAESAGYVFVSNYKPAFWFNVRRADDRIVLEAFSHNASGRTGKALARFSFPTRNCQF